MLGVPAFSALLTVMLVLLSLANHSYRVHALCRPLATKTHPNRVAANSCSDLNCASARDPAGPERMGRALSNWIVGYLLRCATRRRRTARRCWSGKPTHRKATTLPDKFLHAVERFNVNLTGFGPRAQPPWIGSTMTTRGNQTQSTERAKFAALEITTPAE